MSSNLSLAERDRRWRRIDEAMAGYDFDALVFAANDYRGHKGSLRYVADYNLCHRYGYAVKAKGAEPIVVLPQNLGGGRLGGSASWIERFHYARHCAEGLCEIVRELGPPERLGVVGLRQVMRVEEYLHLVEALPNTRVEDASDLFERVRSVKSPEEIDGAEEAAHITDRCFDRLLEIARPGVTERQVAAEMYRTAAALGGEDFLFLTMHEEIRDGGSVPTFGAPRGRELLPRDVHIFSFELVGPTGYWVELARMLTFSAPSEPVQRLARAVESGIDAAVDALGSETDPAKVQGSVLRVAEAEGARSSYWSGHGLGQDVIEGPWVGLEVVQEPEDVRPPGHAIVPGTVLAMHPMLVDDAAGAMGYMSDAVVVGDGAARVLSAHPRTLHRLNHGGVKR